MLESSRSIEVIVQMQIFCQSIPIPQPDSTLITKPDPIMVQVMLCEQEVLYPLNESKQRMTRPAVKSTSDPFSMEHIL